jgi:hypothetical protein
MADKRHDAREPEGPRSFRDRRKGPRKQKDFVTRATALGHSGYGSESVRPHLRDQLKLKELMGPPFPTPGQEGPSTGSEN